LASPCNPKSNSSTSHHLSKLSKLGGIINAMKPNLDQIKVLLNKHIEILKDNYHVKDIGVFGSVARSENTATSDIDILVEFSQPIGFFKFIELEEYLSKLLSKKVDLVTKKALKPSLKEAILQEVIYV